MVSFARAKICPGVRQLYLRSEEGASHQARRGKMADSVLEQRTRIISLISANLNTL